VTAAVASTDWRIVLIVAVVIVIALILGFRLMHRDPSVKSTRYGFYVERERYDEEIVPPNERDTAEHHWPRREDEP